MPNRTGVPFPPPLVPVTAIGAGALATLWVPRWPVGTGWMIAGGLLLASCAAFAAWAILLMRRHRTTISPFGAATHLLTSGPYRLSRNPIYVALLMTQTSVALAFGLTVTLALVPVSGLVLDRLVVRREEAFLRDAFPSEFAAYSSRVRRWL